MKLSTIMAGLVSLFLLPVFAHAKAYTCYLGEAKEGDNTLIKQMSIDAGDENAMDMGWAVEDKLLGACFTSVSDKESKNTHSLVCGFFTPKAGAKPNLAQLNIADDFDDASLALTEDGSKDLTTLMRFGSQRFFFTCK